MHTSFNKANVAVLGPWLVVLAMGLDSKFGWGFTEAWYGAAASIFVWVLTYATPNRDGRSNAPMMRCAVVLPLLLIALAAAGCSMLPYGPQVKAIADQAAVTAVEDRKAFNDKRLTISVAAICDNALGAVLRVEDDQVRNSLFALCGGEGQTVTMDRLADLLNAIEQLKAAGS